MKHTQQHILLVEDDKIDIMTTVRALKEIKVTNEIDVVNNGEEALQHLEKNMDNKPCIILLDLNMPKMNGIEFLKIAKAREEWKSIPIVVLTTSKGERDIVDSFRLGVAGYMVKPVSYHQFVETMRTINIYWTISETP